MSILKVAGWNSIAVGTRLASGLLLNKILAITVGPSGYAMLGQLQNFISIVVTASTGAIGPGVTKYTAEFGDGDTKRQHAVWSTACVILVCCSSPVVLALIIWSRTISEWLFNDRDLWFVFVLLGASVVLMAAQGLLIAIINGKKDIKRYVAVNISSSLLVLMLTSALAYGWGVHGALIALVAGQAVAGVTASILIRNAAWFKVKYLFKGADRRVAVGLGKYILIGIIGAAIMPITHLVVRHNIITQLGLEAAGHWNALTKISDIAFVLLTSTLSVYYLPRLAEIRTAQALRAEVASLYKIVLPIALVGCSAIYVVRPLIIAVLFTHKFALVADLLFWQLVGDFFKIGSWILAYILIGRAMLGAYVATEIGFSLIFIAASFYGIRINGLAAVPMAHALSYGIYWVVVAVIVTRYYTVIAKDKVAICS